MRMTFPIVIAGYNLMIDSTDITAAHKPGCIMVKLRKGQTFSSRHKDYILDYLKEEGFMPMFEDDNGDCVYTFSVLDSQCKKLTNY